MSAHLFIECPCGYFVPVDFESTGGLTAGLRPARITNPQLQPWGLQIPENIVVITGMITNTCPCGFAIHRVVNCGSATRADNISAFTVSGITNPRGHRSDNGNDNDTRPCGFAIHRVVNCGSATRCGVLFISSLHEQRRNRTKEETRRLIAKKLKIEACFPKLAKRPRFARLDEARSSRKTSSIFFTLFC